MAGDVVIRAEGLGKKYVLGHQHQEAYSSLRDTLSRTARNLARTTRDILSGKALVSGDELEEFWALKDVNFEISRGDVVGIIGRNGAGKSTLLKVLSRITEPTEGQITIKGRVASLLEVGTGFHPELSGRENIFLNGAVLGMTRLEIKRKFDEIVEFADVQRFLDTPVKRFSSGMYVRLAFAVAAHLEPEILVIDEVLAVGDAEFQMKCLGKMKDVANSGRTVLFVSHNMGAISRLCGTAAYLSAGGLKQMGDVDTVLRCYASDSVAPAIRRRSQSSHGHPTIDSVVTCDDELSPKADFFFNESVMLRVWLGGKSIPRGTALSVTVTSKDDAYLFTQVVDIAEKTDVASPVEIRLRIPPSILAPKTFAFRVAIFILGGVVFDVLESVCPFSVADNGSGMEKYERFDYGQIVVNCKTEVVYESLQPIP